MPFPGVRSWFLMVSRQLAIVAVSYWLAWLLRFDFVIPAVERHSFITGLAIVLSAKLVVVLYMRQHLEHWWGDQSFADLIRLLGVNAVAAIVAGAAIFAVLGSDFPRSIYLLDPLVSILMSGGIRFAARLYRELDAEWSARGQRGLLIYGAGVAGITLAREIRANPTLGYKVLGFIDDNPAKLGRRVIGITVLGTGEQISRVVSDQAKRGQSIKEIVVAMPAATGRQIRLAQARGLEAGINTRIVPGLGELISGKLAVGRLREISVTDLLGREPIDLDLDTVRRATVGRSILVTGAAGSIGTELCTQLAQFEPLLLIALDQAESELFRLEADLRARCPGVELVFEVGDIRDPLQVDRVISQYKVNSIFHAAAYKHVPLMERQVCEAVRNNVLGTWNLAQAAWRANVSDFLLISTDKAVNPTSIMGLTKRVAELIVSAQRSPLAGGAPTRFVCVRFGNVLVSNGSVVPTFQKQIAGGGPVTVTHQDMRRYFMTVQEAVHLVLQSSAIGKGTEVFVLDMGEPVKILDMARNMITLAGFIPDEDIEIRFTGLRPGEKIFEEISLDSEGIIATSHPKIKVFQGKQVTFQALAPWVAELQHLLWRREPQAVIAHLKALVPEYQPEGIGSIHDLTVAPLLQTGQAAQELPLVQAFKTAAG